jgi:hypothetical protein
MKHHMRHLFSPILILTLACTSARLYYVQSELPTLEGKDYLTVGPGPWPKVPVVVSDQDTAPDILILATLKALMTLPGAADACDAFGHPRADATEYCVAAYKTPKDWRVTWPIRKPVDEDSACQPPFGGVEDAEFGRDLFIFGYAHNHTCGLFASSEDFKVFPTAKTPEGIWMFVSYATTPSGKLARDALGEPIPAWGWLATGHADEPRFYKWTAAGEVFKWSEDQKTWKHQATCKPQPPSMYHKQALPPRCSPELVDWY